jgi:hypothetical protein
MPGSCIVNGDAFCVVCCCWCCPVGQAAAFPAGLLQSTHTRCLCWGCRVSSQRVLLGIEPCPCVCAPVGSMPCGALDARLQANGCYMEQRPRTRVPHCDETRPCLQYPGRSCAQGHGSIPACSTQGVHVPRGTAANLARIWSPPGDTQVSVHIVPHLLLVHLAALHLSVSIGCSQVGMLAMCLQSQDTAEDTLCVVVAGVVLR